LDFEFVSDFEIRISSFAQRQDAMKFRKRWVLNCIGLVGAWVIRIYMSTICFRFRALGRDVNPRLPNLQGRYIYAFWHETVLLPCAVFGRRKVLCLISEHADGELIAQVCRHLGFGVVRGSTYRGAVRALRTMIRLAEKYHFAVLPDGPRGPRRHVETGLMFLAARTGLPLVLAGIGYDRPWRLRTWDRFAIPKPFSKAVILTAEPLYVPADATRPQLEEYRARAEAILNSLTTRAEKLAEA
jgi:lysophospholipid acyltransferase (LPLAT)-like uncharacterized protein